MGGTLIFTTSKLEREQLSLLLGAVEAINVPDAVGALQEGKIIAVSMNMCVGWRAPEGTKILFTESFPKHGPERVQAEMRVMVR